MQSSKKPVRVSASSYRKIDGHRGPALLVMASLCLLSGCASIVRGTHQDIEVRALPATASVRHDATGRRWTTPATISLERRSRHVLIVHASGYRSQEMYIRSEANIGWWIVDAFSLGVGNALDALIGGLFDLKPERIHVVLEPNSVEEDGGRSELGRSP